jgi:hypothetical protein
VRRVRRRPAGAVLLFEDETILRLFPPLRCAWAPRGEQAEVPLSGWNARRVLFGALNPRTGHRVVMRRAAMRRGDFQEFLRRLRRCYGGRELWLVLDSASCHIATQTQTLAARLSIKLLWLPVRCAELNAMDHLWRHLKGQLAANRQFATVDELAERAAQWVLDLSPNESRRKAGVLSKNFWLPT